LSSADADADGLPDYWEILIGPTNGAEDSDGDGATNAEEFLAGTAHLDPESRLMLASTLTPGSVVLSFEALPGKSYAVQKSTNLQGWNSIQIVPVEADSRPIEVVDADEDRAYYRLITPAP
jgi:hypothetical protein